MIQEAKYEFRADQWSQITFDAKDLVCSLSTTERDKSLNFQVFFWILVFI